MTTHDNNHISAVRAHLLATMADLRNPDSKMDVARARAISEVAQTIINSAKVEVDYLRATNQTTTPFLEVPAEVHTGTLPSVTPGITRNSADDVKPMVKRTNWVGMTA